MSPMLMIIIRSAMLHAKSPLNSGWRIDDSNNNVTRTRILRFVKFFIFLDRDGRWNIGILEKFWNVEIYRWIREYIGKFWDTRVRYDDAGVAGDIGIYFFKIVRKKKRNCISLEGYKIHKMLKLWNLSISRIFGLLKIIRAGSIDRYIDYRVLLKLYMETLH